MTATNEHDLNLNKRYSFPRTVSFIKIFPNIVTIIGLITGVSSIRFALDGKWEKSVYCILIAVIIDGLDGRIARILKATSNFGAGLDSLCDFVNFGLCPALLTYLWSFQQYEYKVASWSSILFFIVCMALRLARFNRDFFEVQSLVNKNNKYVEKKYSFLIGVPAPFGALLALTPIMVDFDIANKLSFSVKEYTILINCYIAAIAILSASKLPTISLTNIRIKQEYVFLYMILFSIMAIMCVIYPWYVIPILSVSYILSMPFCMYYHRRNNKILNDTAII